jgi:hypothetical protein
VAHGFCSQDPLFQVQHVRVFTRQPAADSGDEVGGIGWAGTFHDERGEPSADLGVELIGRLGHAPQGQVID